MKVKSNTSIGGSGGNSEQDGDIFNEEGDF